MNGSVSHGRTVKSAFLVIIMIIMTQVGYLDLINSPRTGNESFADEPSVMGDRWFKQFHPRLRLDMVTNLTHQDFIHAILDNDGDANVLGLNNGDKLVMFTQTPIHRYGLTLVATTVTEVVNGYRHTCATLSNGSLMCWGENSDGQLGNGQRTQTQTTPVWVDLGVGRTATRIAADYGNTCAIVDNGSLYCWGTNTHRKTWPRRPTIRVVANAPTWVDLGGNAASAVDVGGMHVCSILNNEQHCWGDDLGQELGRGGPFYSWSP